MTTAMFFFATSFGYFLGTATDSRKNWKIRTEAARATFVCAFVFAALLLCSCAHQPIVVPMGSGGAINKTEAPKHLHDVPFNAEGRALWISKGVPAEWFVVEGDHWIISDLHYHAGNSIRLKNANP